MYRSPAYLSFIRTHKCCMCGNPETVCHHEPLKKAGTSIKAPDSHGLPLCTTCHAQRHQMGSLSFFRSVDVPMVIIGYLTEYLEKLEGKEKA